MTWLAEEMIFFIPPQMHVDFRERTHSYNKFRLYMILITTESVQHLALWKLTWRL